MREQRDVARDLGVSVRLLLNRSAAGEGINPSGQQAENPGGGWQGREREKPAKTEAGAGALQIGSQIP